MSDNPWPRHTSVWTWGEVFARCGASVLGTLAQVLERKSDAAAERFEWAQRAGFEIEKLTTEGGG